MKVPPTHSPTPSGAPAQSGGARVGWGGSRSSDSSACPPGGGGRAWDVPEGEETEGPLALQRLLPSGRPPWPPTPAGPG